MNRQKMIEHFEGLMEMIQRPGKDRLMEYIRKSDFYKAPASTKYHLCCEGGLLLHSLNVLAALQTVMRPTNAEDGTWEYANEVVYPFGYGLSYTSFAYAPVKLTPAVTGVQDGLTVTTEVRNTGRRAGDEVAQLYLNFPKVDGAPRVALRGFQRVHLAPGERRMLRFTLDPRDLSAVDADGHRLVMKGDYRVSVGSGQPDTGVAGRSATFAVATPRPIAD